MKQQLFEATVVVTMWKMLGCPVVTSVISVAQQLVTLKYMYFKTSTKHMQIWPYHCNIMFY